MLKFDKLGLPGARGQGFSDGFGTDGRVSAPFNFTGYWPAFFNGYYWCQEIRKTSRVPIMFLSSHDQPMDIVMAINMGADDYVTKPFEMTVL